MDLDLVPSAIAVVPDRDVAYHGVSLGMQSFTGYFNKMASIHFIKKKKPPRSQNVPPIQNRVSKIIFVPIDMTKKLLHFINFLSVT